MVKKMFSVKGLRIICTALAAVALLSLIVNVTLSSIENNKYRKDRDLKQKTYESLLETIEFNGLSDTTKEKAAELAELYGDYSNIIVTDEAGNVIYNLNEGYMPDMDVFNVIVDTEQGSRFFRYTYIIDKNNSIKYRIEFNSISNPLRLFNFSKKFELSDTMLSKDENSTFLYNRSPITSDKYMNYTFIGSKGWNIYTIFKKVDSRQFDYFPGRFNFIDLLLKGFAIVSFLLFWLLLPIWVFMDARKINFKPSLWGILVLFTNIVGLIVYLVVKPEPLLCKGCSRVLSSSFVICPYCGMQNKDLCKKCKGVMEDVWNICPYCGTERVEKTSTDT